MIRKLLNVPADPHRPASAATDEDPRKIVIAFFLAIALYLGAGFGTLVHEKIALDAVQAELMVAETASAVEVDQLPA